MHDVGGHHQARPRQAIGPDATDQEERDQRQHLRREHDADVGGAAGEVRHEQREGDDHDAVAEHAGARREPQVPERGVAQDA